jgi:hypothetical protein
MKAARDNPPAPTPALVLGRAIHARVLEPDRFADCFRVAGRCSADTKGGERCSRTGTHLLADPRDAWVCSQHYDRDYPPPVRSDFTTITPEQRDIANAVAGAIDSHAMAGRLLRAKTEAELSIVWDDPLTGIRCKARLDAYAPVAGGTIPDIKTALDGDPLTFRRTLLKWGYHRKAWFYLRGAKAVGLEARHFPIIAAEKAPPWAVVVYRVDDDVISYLENHMTALLELYALCEARQEWPSYSEIIREVSLPAWGWNQIDDETEEVRGRLAALRAKARAA